MVKLVVGALVPVHCLVHMMTLHVVVGVTRDALMMVHTAYGDGELIMV